MDITCPTVTKVIAGNSFELRMDFNALVLAEKASGKNFMDPSIFTDMNVTDATTLFWACAVQTNSKLTLSDVRKLGYRHITEVVKGCREAWRAAIETPEEDPRPISGLVQPEAVPAQ